MRTSQIVYETEAEAEIKATDSVTAELLADAVDQRAGGMGLLRAQRHLTGETLKRHGLLVAERLRTRLQELRTQSASSQ